MTALATWVGVALVAIWGIVAVDIVRSPRPPAVRALWLIACTLVWPSMVLYWLTRPMPGRALRTEPRTDPRAALVAAALDHEAGRIDDAEMARRVAALRVG